MGNRKLTLFGYLRLTMTMWSGTRMRSLYRLLDDERGASAIEYALIAALIAVVAAVAFMNLGNEVQSSYSSTQAKVAASNDR